MMVLCEVCVCVYVCTCAMSCPVMSCPAHDAILSCTCTDSDVFVVGENLEDLHAPYPRQSQC